MDKHETQYGWQMRGSNPDRAVVDEIGLEDDHLPAKDVADGMRRADIVEAFARAVWPDLPEWRIALLRATIERDDWMRSEVPPANDTPPSAIGTLQGQIDELRQDVVTADERAKWHSGRVEALAARIAALEASQAERTAAASETAAKLDAVDNRVAKLEDWATWESARVTGTAARVGALDDATGTIKDRIEQQENKTRAHDGVMAELAGQLANLSGQLSALTANVDRMAAYTPLPMTGIDASAPAQANISGHIDVATAPDETVFTWPDGTQCHATFVEYLGHLKCTKCQRAWPIGTQPSPCKYATGAKP